MLNLIFRLLSDYGDDYKGETADEKYGVIPAATLICPECMSTSIHVEDSMSEGAVGGCLNCGYAAHFSQFQSVDLGLCSVCGEPAAGYCAGCRMPVCYDCIAEGYPKRPLCYGCF